MARLLSKQKIFITIKADSFTAALKDVTITLDELKKKIDKLNKTPFVIESSAEGGEKKPKRKKRR